MNYKDIDISKVLKIKNIPRIELKEPKFYKGAFKDFQKKGIAYMYFCPKCGLFDTCGSGKSHHIMGLISLLKERKELGRCLYLVPSADILAKVDEFSKFTSLDFGAAVGNISNRVSLYNTWLDVLMVSYEIIRGRDLEYLGGLEWDTVFLDESHIFRNSNTKTFRAIRKLTETATRVHILSATPIQTSLIDLYNQLKILGLGIFSSERHFRRRYCEEETLYFRNGKRLVTRDNIVSYKHIDEFKRIIEPFFLRRTIEDIESEMPDLVTDKIWGNLNKVQAKLYKELQKGVVELLKSGQKVEAKKHIHNMQKVVNSTKAIGADGKDYSWKFDWIISQLYSNAELGFNGPMAQDKVVIFAQHKDTLKVLGERLEALKIKYVLMTGEESKTLKHAYKKRFWDDPDCRVMLGTTAIECSANLQCARYLIAVDVLANPARVSQLVGRIRRTGSVYKTAFFIMLLSRATFEERLIEKLEKRQAVHDNIFNENSDIFNELSVQDLLTLFK
jgi:SNF2 family DNA or RNA helicase